MIERLIRLGLALAVAFVFTGRMEAATAHCARLVADEQAAAERTAATPAHHAQPEAAPCHGMDEAAVPEHGAHNPATDHPAHHNPMQSQCECIAALAGFASFAPSLTSAHIEPYEWLRPQTAAFASVEPSPELRPPNG